MIELNRERLSNQVYSILKNMKADYRFSPGSRINIEQIARKLGQAEHLFVRRYITS
ncbi:MAG TPA: hypothetical protein PKM38_09825 [Syntrophorhabdaceae bacterium]|nr:hypothetical protein [Syntrophorhabdaceae bacterium]